MYLICNIIFAFLQFGKNLINIHVYVEGSPVCKAVNVLVYNMSVLKSIWILTPCQLHRVISGLTNRKLSVKTYSCHVFCAGTTV